MGEYNAYKVEYNQYSGHEIACIYSSRPFFCTPYQPNYDITNSSRHHEFIVVAVVKFDKVYVINMQCK